MKKEYLGDSVYAEYDGFGVWLTTENGGEPSNQIYLEPRTLEALKLITNMWRRPHDDSKSPEGKVGE